MKWSGSTPTSSTSPRGHTPCQVSSLASCRFLSMTFALLSRCSKSLHRDLGEKVSGLPSNREPPQGNIRGSVSYFIVFRGKAPMSTHFTSNTDITTAHRRPQMSLTDHMDRISVCSWEGQTCTCRPAAAATIACSRRHPRTAILRLARIV
jgi:hypothetical protein